MFRQAYNVFVIFLLIILVLQNAIFSILTIQYSNSILFRLFIGFVGIGMVIVPIVLKHVVSFHAKKSVTNAIVFLFGLFFIVIAPWISIVQTKSAFKLEIFAAIITPGAVMALSSSIFAFIIVGFMAVKRDWEETSLGFNIFKMFLLALCILAAGNLYFPTFLILVYQFALFFGKTWDSIYDLANTYPFWNAINHRIANIYYWQIAFFISLYFQSKFYIAWMRRKGDF